MKLTITYVLMFLVFLNAINAQNLCGSNDNPCKDNWENFDYANKNAVISKIPADKVVIQKVIANGRGNELTPEQIAPNFDEIPDLTKDVDRNKAIEAIQKKYGITIDLGKGANLKEGVLSATYGKKDYVPLSHVSKTTLVKIDEKGSILLIGEKKPPKEGSYTAVYQKTTLAQTPDGKEIFVTGKLNYREGQAHKAKNEELILEGIKIKGNDVNIYFDGKEHQGGYISYGQKNLIAEGNNFALEFLPENRFVKVFPEDPIDRRNPFYDQLPFVYQNDHFSTYLGDSTGKSAKIILTNRDELNLMPLLETRDYVRILNGGNDVVASGQQVSQKFVRSADKSPKGSVSVEMVAGGNTKKVYDFDEDSRVIALSDGQSKRLNEMRTNIIRNHNVALIGFFSEEKLKYFDYNLNTLEKLGVDFSQYEKVEGKQIKILQFNKGDFKGETNPDTQVMGFSDTDYNSKIPVGRVIIYPFHETSFPTGDPVHEIGHLISDGKDTRLNQKFVAVGSKSGMELNINDFAEYMPNSGPAELFPTRYSREALREYKPEILMMMAFRPQWFTDPYEGIYDKENNKGTRLSKPVSPKIMKQRQAFRDLWLEELKKYKK